MIFFSMCEVYLRFLCSNLTYFCKSLLDLQNQMIHHMMAEKRAMMTAIMVYYSMLKALIGLN